MDCPRPRPLPLTRLTDIFPVKFGGGASVTTQTSFLLASLRRLTAGHYVSDYLHVITAGRTGGAVRGMELTTDLLRRKKTFSSSVRARGLFPDRGCFPGNTGGDSVLPPATVDSRQTFLAVVPAVDRLGPHRQYRCCRSRFCDEGPSDEPNVSAFGSNTFFPNPIPSPRFSYVHRGVPLYGSTLFESHSLLDGNDYVLTRVFECPRDDPTGYLDRDTLLADVSRETSPDRKVSGEPGVPTDGRRPHDH